MTEQASPIKDDQYRLRTTREDDYNFIVQNNQDRYPFVHDMMNTVVVDNLKKTAKSYHKKRKW